MSNVCFTVSHIVLSLTPLWLRLPLVLMGEAVAIRSGSGVYLDSIDV